MAHPADIIERFGPLLMAGDLSGLAARYAMPFAVAMGGRQEVVNSVDEAKAAFANLYDVMRGCGAERAVSKPVSQIYLDTDLVLAAVETEFTDANGNRIDRTSATYLLRATDDDWRILTVTVDQPIRDVTGLCLPIQEAA